MKMTRARSKQRGFFGGGLGLALFVVFAATGTSLIAIEEQKTEVAVKQQQLAESNEIDFAQRNNSN